MLWESVLLYKISLESHRPYDKKRTYGRYSLTVETTSSSFDKRWGGRATSEKRLNVVFHEVDRPKQGAEGGSRRPTRGDRRTATATAAGRASAKRTSLGGSIVLSLRSKRRFERISFFLRLSLVFSLFVFSFLFRETFKNRGFWADFSDCYLKLLPKFFVFPFRAPNRYPNSFTATE